VSGKSLGEPDLIVAAPDFGDPRSATTSRYTALADAAAEAGWRMLIVNTHGIYDPGGSTAAYQGPAKRNKLSLPRRALGEILDGFRMAARLPASGTVLVAIPSLFSALAVGTYLRLVRRQYWLDVRDLYPDVLVSSRVVTQSSIVIRVLERWLRWLYEGADRVIAVTSDLERRLRERTPPSIPVTLVRNGFGKRFTVNDTPNLERPLIATHGTMGRFQNTKLLADIVIAARRAGLHWRFLVIGDGPTAHELERARGDTLRIIPFAAQAELPLLLQEAAVGLSLRTDDDISAGSIPVRLLEYIGLGVPVVIYPASEGGDEVSHLQIGVVLKTADADSAIASISSLLRAEKHHAARTSILAHREDFSASKPWRDLLHG
jgi:glycosyltransferase involved in cell wall biosynthesis